MAMNAKWFPRSVLHSPRRIRVSVSAMVACATLFVLLMPLLAIGQDARLAEQARLRYKLDMENVSLDEQGVRQGPAKIYRIRRAGGAGVPEIVHDPVINSKVLVIRTGATPAGAPNDRSELQVYSGISFGRTWALGMRVYIPPNIVFSDNWHLLMQCFQDGVTGHPPLSFNLIAPNTIGIVSRSDEDRYRRLYSTPLPTGRWVKLELEFRMGPDGNVKFWMDDKLLTEQKAILRFKAGTDRCTLKVGTYRGKTSIPHEVRLDDIHLGDSRDVLRMR